MTLTFSIALALATNVSIASSENTADHVARFEIAVTDRGFEPRLVSVKAGQPVELVFLGKTDRSCTRDLILDAGGVKLRIALLVNEPAAIKTQFASAASFRYTCGKSTFVGRVVVR